MPAGDQAAASGSFHRTRAAVATTFAAHAVVSSSFCPWIPHLKADNGLDAGGLGIPLTGLAVGLVLGTALAGPAIRRAGGRGTVRVGVPIMIGAFALLSVANGLGSLTATFFAFGIASGIVEVAMNIEAVAVEQRFGRRVMSDLCGVWSLSMLAGTSIASAGVAASIPTGAFLSLLSALLVAASFPLLRWLPSAHDVGRTRVDPELAETRSCASPAPSYARILLLCIVGGAAIMTGDIVSDWSAVYLCDSLGASPGTASLGIVAFSAGMATSRFAGDRLAVHIDESVLVRAGVGIAALALTCALCIGGVVLSIVALVLVGLTLGPVVPFAYRAAGQISLGGGRTGLPMAVTAGYVASIMGPMSVGFIADEVGLRTALVVPVIACIAAALAASAAHELRASRALRASGARVRPSHGAAPAAG